MQTPATEPSGHVRAEPRLRPVRPAAMYVRGSNKHRQPILDEYTPRRPLCPLNVRYPYLTQIVNIVKDFVPRAYLFNGCFTEQMLQQLARTVEEKVTRAMSDTIVH